MAMTDEVIDKTEQESASLGLRTSRTCHVKEEMKTYEVHFIVVCSLFSHNNSPINILLLKSIFFPNHQLDGVSVCSFLQTTRPPEITVKWFCEWSNARQNYRDHGLLHGS